MGHLSACFSAAWMWAQGPATWVPFFGWKDFLPHLVIKSHAFISFKTKENHLMHFSWTECNWRDHCPQGCSHVRTSVFIVWVREWGKAALGFHSLFFFKESDTIRINWKWSPHWAKPLPAQLCLHLTLTCRAPARPPQAAGRWEFLLVCPAGRTQGRGHQTRPSLLVKPKLRVLLFVLFV